MGVEIRRVLYSTDYSEASELALPVAVGLASTYHAELVVLHVAERLVDVVPVAAGVPPIEMDLEAEPSESARERLEEWAEERLADDLNFRIELVDGDAAEMIVEVADEQDADIVVLGTQGHSRVERFLIGSVTEKVLRRAHCPVLAVPSEKRRRGQNVD